jgi:hypothetical protein
MTSFGLVSSLGFATSSLALDFDLVGFGSTGFFSTVAFLVVAFSLLAAYLFEALLAAFSGFFFSTTF